MSESVCRLAGDMHQLDELSGVGKSIGAKIQEFCTTGKIMEFEKLRKNSPEDLMELMQVEGIGPALIRQLHEKFHVETRSALKKILQKPITLPKGIGQKKIHLLCSSLQIELPVKKRYLYEEVLPQAEKLMQFIKQIPHVENVILAGSLRRRKETIGDVDIVLAVREQNRKNVLDRIISYTDIRRVLVKGNTKLSLLMGENQIQCDIRLVEKESLGSALLYFTGSKEHNILLRAIAKKRGWKINEYGLFDQQGIKLAGRTETEIYQRLGLNFIPPEKRVGGNEISEAKMDEGKADMVW
jgi:DNA polymerase (family 10)